MRGCVQIKYKVCEMDERRKKTIRCKDFPQG